MEPKTKVCCDCSGNLSLSNFFRQPGRTDGLSSYCKTCHMARTRAHERANPKKRIFYSKRGAAKTRGVPFSLEFSDISWPDYCPALGTKLDYSLGIGHTKDPRITPSFDRLDNSLGYEPGNVVIISKAANSIKSSFTATDVQLVADWLRRVQPQ